MCSRSSHRGWSPRSSHSPISRRARHLAWSRAVDELAADGAVLAHDPVAVLGPFGVKRLDPPQPAIPLAERRDVVLVELGARRPVLTRGVVRVGGGIRRAGDGIGHRDGPETLTANVDGCSPNTVAYARSGADAPNGPHIPALCVKSISFPRERRCHSAKPNCRPSSWGLCCRLYSPTCWRRPLPRSVGPGSNR